MSLTPLELIAEYRIAFRNCNPDRPVPNIVYERGWFKFADWAGRNYRRTNFCEMLDTLRRRSNERTAALSPQGSEEANG